MHTNRILIVGTMVIAISFSSGIWNDKANASTSLSTFHFKCKKALSPLANVELSGQDRLLQMIGISSEELYYALYNSKSLANIAEEHNVDAQSIIDLQIAEMKQQLAARLDNQSLTTQQYQSHLTELKDVITASVYGKG